jgi:hypothetical protein
LANVKVVVTALRRYWALGRCFEQGDTELELDEEQLAQLDAAKGGVKLEQVGLDRSNPEQRSPCVLSYRIVADPPPAPLPEVAPPLEVTDAPGEPPHIEFMQEPAANAED